MLININSFLLAAAVVTLAEMGDKTQLLAMAFAAKYKAGKVLIGVFVATVLNHALAVAAGSFLVRFEPLRGWVQGVAALSFILFGLWTIKGDKLEGEENKKTRFGPVMTVIIAFFLAELGDKTQLATIALAAKYPGSPLGVLAGTTTGMLIADALGICLGAVMAKRIPEKTIKLAAAGAFILFGLFGCFQVAREFLQMGITQALFIIGGLAMIAWFYAYRLVKE